MEIQTRRRIVQAGVLLFFAAAVYLFFSVNPFLIHEYCPFSAICVGPVYDMLFNLPEGQRQAAGVTGFQPWALWGVVFSVVIIVSALLLRRGFCGWVCPLGTVQDFSLGLFRRLGAGAQNQPATGNFAGGAFFFRLFILTVVLIGGAGLGSMVYMIGCPWISITGFASGWIAMGGVFILALLVAGPILSRRLFCRLFCPFGVLLGMVSLAGAKIFPGLQGRVRRKKCFSCANCDGACPSDAYPTRQNVFTDANCTLCMECVSACRVKGASCLEFAWGGRPDVKEIGKTGFGSTEKNEDGENLPRRAFMAATGAAALGMAVGTPLAALNRKGNVCKICGYKKCDPACRYYEKPVVPEFFEYPLSSTFKIDSTLCMGCEKCVPACTYDAIFMRKGKAVIRQDKCTRCGDCERVCPVLAVSVFDREGREMKHSHHAVIYRVRPETCIGCLECAPVCPVDAVLRKDSKAWIDPKVCTQCSDCVPVCPNASITLVRKKDGKPVPLADLGF